MSDPRIPVDELRVLANEIDGLRRRLDLLEGPSGTQAFRSVAKLQDAIELLQQQQAALEAQQAELTDLVDNLEGRLDAYLATEAPALIAAEVASQLAAILAGDVSIGGDLHVDGTVTLPGARSTFVGGATPGRVTAWIAGDGRLGHTA